MPAGRLLSRGPLAGALTPIVTFADVPRIQFDHQGEGFLGQRQPLLVALGRSHLLVELGALFVRAPALATRLPIQRGRRQFHASQPLNDCAGFVDGHFADR